MNHIKLFEDFNEDNLESAISKTNIQLIRSIKNGEEITLNNNYVLYKYLEDDIIVIVRTEDWIEELQVMENGDDVIFEEI